MKTNIALIVAAISVGCLVVAAGDANQANHKKIPLMNSAPSAVVSVRYMVDDVGAAIAFYTNHLGFSLDVDSSPAFASVVRGDLRLLLSGEKSSGRRPLSD